ncbi:uncharacterized protein [Phaseolus vulgaris]
MTINLAESINYVLKKTRNLPISPMVMATFTCCNKFFTDRGRQVEAMVVDGHVYSEVAAKALEDEQLKANTHTVISFDSRNTKFLVEERQNPRKVRPPGRFAVRLDELWFDYGKFQKLHLPCSHVLAACKYAHHDFARYISHVYTLQQVFHVYEGLFCELKNEGYWSAYTGQILCLSPDMKITSKGRPKSSRIRTYMDIREQHDRTKKCAYCQTPGHTKRKCPNITRSSTSRH